MNAACHPYVTVMNGTAAGATTAPMFAPELKIPVASALSLFGNHFGNRFNRRREIGRFPQSQGKPRGAESERRTW